MSMQVHIVSNTALSWGNGVRGRLLQLRRLWCNPHSASLLFCCWLCLSPGLRAFPIRWLSKLSFIVEVVDFLKVRKRDMETGLWSTGTLGIESGVHMMVEEHSFRAIDGWVQDGIRLQVLTVEIHPTGVCAVGRQGWTGSRCLGQQETLE